MAAAAPHGQPAKVGKLFFIAASVFAQVRSFAGEVCVIIKFCLQLLECEAAPEAGR